MVNEFQLETNHSEESVFESWLKQLFSYLSSNLQNSELLKIHFPKNYGLKQKILYFKWGRINKSTNRFPIQLANLHLAWEMWISYLQVNSYSRVVVNQVKGEYQAKEKTLMSYLNRFKLATFLEVKIQRSANLQS